MLSDFIVNSAESGDSWLLLFNELVCELGLVRNFVLVLDYH